VSRVALRALRPEDAEAIYAYRADPTVSRYQSWAPCSLDEVRAFIDGLSDAQPFTPGAWHQLGIELRSNGALIGDTGILVLENDPSQAEFGLTLAPAFQRRGYAAEAARAVLTILFDELGKHRVLASIDPRNERSIALFVKLGFRQEAHHVESLWFKGAWADDVIYALLAHEWRAMASAIG
jgi:RimJ/RimL family protein N-acetyltransferase